VNNQKKPKDLKNRNELFFDFFDIFDAFDCFNFLDFKIE